MKRLNKIINENSILLHCHYDKGLDLLTVTMKDKETGKKSLYNIPKPYVPVYILKDKKVEDFQEHAHLSDLDVYWVRESNRIQSIADILNIKNYAEKVRNGNLPWNYIYLHKRCIGSDIKIEELLIREYCKYFVQDDNGIKIVSPPIINKFHIGALDIETDINVSDERSKQPINVITYIDNESWTIKTIATIDSKYKGQKEVMKDIEGFEKELIDLIRDNITNLSLDIDDEDRKSKQEASLKEILLPVVDKLKLDLTFTQSETSMIRSINKYIFSEERNPDYLYIYNAEYDISQQQMRCQELNINFDNLFKYKDKPTFTNFDMRDKRFSIKKKIHTYDINNPTKILDQMLEYYHLRSNRIFAKHSLDATAKRELGTAKLDYSKICNWIGDFPYIDYKTFLMYNIVDVLIMLLLDMVTNDTSNLVYRRFNMQTEWNNLSRSSVRTTRAFDFIPYLDGYIMSNEINPLLLKTDNYKMEDYKSKNPKLYNIVKRLQEANVGKDEVNPHAIPGGLCTKPSLIHPSIKESNLYGNLDVKSYSKFSYCADDDATSMYPMNVVANNASKATFYGIIDGIDGIKDPDYPQTLSMAIINQNLSSIGNMLYNLPTAEDLLKRYKGIYPEFKEDILDNLNYDNLEIDPKNKAAWELIRLYKACYNTKYADIDQKVGYPSNRLLVFTDNESTEFSYYDTKVIITTVDTTPNTIIGHQGKGTTCGTILKGEIINKSEDYINYLMIQNEDPEIEYIISEGTIEGMELKSLSEAKYLAKKIDLEVMDFHTLNRAIFSDFKVPIKWTLNKIYKNDKCYLLRLLQEYNLKYNKVMIEQRIVVYNLNNEE